MKQIILLSLMFLLCVTPVSASTVQLDKNTDLHPQGWVSGSLVFKGGTEVVFNDKGEVVSGVLKYHESLTPAGYANMGGGTFVLSAKNDGEIYFRSDRMVVFNDRGEVVEGTLSDNVNARIVKESPCYLPLVSDSYIQFDANGSVVKATIKLDSYLRPAGWESGKKGNAGFVKYKGGSEITFNDKGEVVSVKTPISAN